MASDDEMPRPFLSAATAEIEPEMIEEFKRRYAEAVANWDGTLRVIKPVTINLVEWEVRYDDGSLSGAVLLDYDDARQLAERQPDRNPMIVYRTISDWREADHA